MTESPPPPLRILICDDHRVVRAGLRQILQDEPDLEIVGEAATADEAVELARSSRPDVAIMDLSFGDGSGISATEAVGRASPDTRVLILTMHEDPAYARDALRAGALGFVVKRAADVDLVLAIRTVAAGAVYLDSTIRGAVLDDRASPPSRSRIDTLSRRESEVLRFLAEGLTNQEIASVLHLSTRTVETYRANVQQKLGVRTRAELTRFARDVGFS